MHARRMSSFLETVPPAELQHLALASTFGFLAFSFVFGPFDFPVVSPSDLTKLHVTQSSSGLQSPSTIVLRHYHDLSSQSVAECLIRCSCSSQQQLGRTPQLWSDILDEYRQSHRVRHTISTSQSYCLIHISQLRGCSKNGVFLSSPLRRQYTPVWPLSRLFRAQCRPMLHRRQLGTDCQSHS